MKTAKKHKGRITIDRELCKGCRYCVVSCPEKALSIENLFNELGYFPAFFEYPDRCTGCAICAQICPDIAIEVWRE